MDNVIYHLNWKNEQQFLSNQTEIRMDTEFLSRYFTDRLYELNSKHHLASIIADRVQT